jgi:hypothetical protein
MLNLILNAVTKQLGTTFGNGYRYYVENVEQGLIKPGFTVKLLAPSQRSKSPILYERTMPLLVLYYSDSENDINNDCYSMGEQVVECLEYLPFEGGLIRGKDISLQIVDNVLQVFVTYQFTTKKVTEAEDAIETLETNVAHTK